MNQLRENLKDIQCRIADAAARANRDPDSIRLIAVTKTVPAEAINEAISIGIREIGENRAQEWAAKSENVNILKTFVHYIGQVQSNKLKLILKTANIIHSLDKLPIALEIERLLEADEEGGRRKVLVQVNIGRETQKGGVLEEDLPALLEGVSRLKRVEVIGLMCIPPFDEAARPYFERLRRLAERMDALSCPNVGMKELSMGMSSDFEEAIMEGATMVRVGSALFGSRSTQ